MLFDQSLVIDFLSDRASYVGLHEPVKKIQTHGALVFLAGNDVYKIKRDVRYPYLDFSSLEKRKQACERELEINREITPEIYLDLVPVTATTDGTLAIDGSGTVVEWAVHMRRFDDDLLLQNLADHGELTSTIAEDAAKAVAQFHQRAPRIAGAGAATRLDHLVTELVNHFTTSEDYLSTEKFDFSSQLKEQTELIKDLIELRGSDGFVVRGHGDLHLGNLVMLHDKPTLFDALEYSEEFATVDVLYDLAFLIMDLEVNGLTEQANRALTAYLNATDVIQNLDGLTCLPVFLALRAGVRAMVETHRAQQFLEAPRPQAMSLGAEYLAYANRALAEAKSARLIAIGGYSGTGKTTIARLLAPAIGARPGALHIRSDVERKHLYKVTETTRLPTSSYTSEVSERVYAQMMEKAAHALQAGHSVVLDAVFMSAQDRELAEQIAAQYQVPFTGIWLTAAMDRLHQRVSARTGDASDATVDVVDRQLKTATGAMNWHEVDANGTPAQVTAEINLLIAPHRSNTPEKLSPNNDHRTARMSDNAPGD